jgi:hypothetical protein
VALLAVIGILLWNRAAVQPVTPPAATPVERMWGTPTPRLFDRLIIPQSTEPEHLVSGPIDGYQVLERGFAPAYLVSMPRFAYLGDRSPEGLVGVDPGSEFTAYGLSDLLLEARGPLLCVPRAVVGVETDTEIRFSISWGRPGPDQQDHRAECRMDGMLQTVLIPVQLASDLDELQIVTLGGVPVGEVPVDEG